MRRVLLLAVAMLVAACGTPDEFGADTTGAPEPAWPSEYTAFLRTPDGRTFIESIRDAESLVVGDVWTLPMSDAAIVALAVGLCGLEDAVSVGGEAVERLDWRQPANAEMLVAVHALALARVCDAGLPSPNLPLDAILVPRPEGLPPQNVYDVDQVVATLLATEAGQGFIAAVRAEEGRLSPVFTETMTDAEVVRLTRGICQTETELGEDALAEHDRYLEAYGWTSPSDVAMFDFLMQVRSPVCATVG